MNDSSLPQGDSTSASRVAAVLARLEADVAEFVALDLTELVRLGRPSAELLAVGVRTERLRRQFQAFDTAYVTALEVADEPARNGCPRTETFLKNQLRITPSEAKRRVAAARACAPREEFGAGVLPPERAVLAAAVAQGEVSPEHTAVILAAIERIPDRAEPAVVRDMERRLVRESATFGPASIAVLGRRILDHVDPDGTLRDHEWQQKVRAMTLVRHHDKTGRMVADLTAEAFEVWQTVLDSLAKPVPTGPDGPDPRNYQQRCHDALLDVGRRALDTGELPACGGIPATIVIHVTQEQYAAQPGAPAGLASTGHDNLLPVGSAFALADQAAVCTVLTDAKGVPLELARSVRIATPAQTIALAARDRGCCYPACDRPAAWTQRHHVIPWHAGGRTNVTNMALLCGYHHRTFEQRGWICIMIDGRPWWIPPRWIDPQQTPIRNTFHDHARAGP